MAGAARRSASCSEALVREVVAVAAAEGVNLPLRGCARGDGAHRGGDAGAAARPPRKTWRDGKPQRDRPPQRLRGAPRRRARHRHAGEPDAACAGQAGRVGSWPALDALCNAQPAHNAAHEPGAATRAARIRTGPARARAWPTREPRVRRAADRRRVVRHLAHRHRAAARCAPSARCPSCAWPPTGRRRSSATATRRAGCRWPTRPCPAARRRCWASTRGLGVLVMSYLPPERPPAVEAAAARRRRAMSPTARAVGAHAGAHPRPLGGAPRTGDAVRDRQDLLRHPARTLPAGHRAAPRRPGAGPARAGGADAVARRARWCTAT